jgi:cytochrome c-type biogenesis protein CcmH/NrfG
MTRAQYEEKVKTFDQDRINAMIDRIPQNVNRAGKTYRQLTKQIREEYENNRIPKILRA